MHVPWIATMPGRQRIPIALRLLCLLLAAQVFASDGARSGLPLSADDRHFVSALRIAIRDDNQSWIVKHTSFPLRVNGESGSTEFTSADHLLASFDLVFDRTTREAIRNQVPAETFKNWRGLMIGNGEVWIASVKTTRGATRYYIAAINHRGKTSHKRGHVLHYNAQPHGLSDCRPIDTLPNSQDTRSCLLLTGQIGNGQGRTPAFVCGRSPWRVSKSVNC